VEKSERMALATRSRCMRRKENGFSVTTTLIPCRIGAGIASGGGPRPITGIALLKTRAGPTISFRWSSCYWIFSAKQSGCSNRRVWNS